jgi:hypothetical protein
MKKGLLIFLLLSGIASADPIIVTQGGPKGSQGELEMLHIGKTIRQQGLEIEFHNPGGCVDVVKFWNESTDPTVMAYTSSYGRTEKTQGKPCTADFSKAELVQRRLNPLWLCSGPRPRPMNTPGLRIGYFAPYPMKDIISELNATNNYQWKPIPVTHGFRDSLLQLANGETDYSFLTSGGTGLRDRIKMGEIVCHVSTKPGDSLPYMKTHFKLKGDINQALTIQQITVGKNLEPAQIVKIRDGLNTSEETKNYLNFNDMTNMPMENNQKMITDFWKYVYDGLLEYKK